MNIHTTYALAGQYRMVVTIPQDLENDFLGKGE
jgi:hypothetical protein